MHWTSADAACFAERSFATSEITITSISQENILAISVRQSIHAAIHYSCTPDPNIPNTVFKKDDKLIQTNQQHTIGPNIKTQLNQIYAKRKQKKNLFGNESTRKRNKNPSAHKIKVFRTFFGKQVYMKMNNDFL